MTAFQPQADAIVQVPVSVNDPEVALDAPVAHASVPVFGWGWLPAEAARDKFASAHLQRAFDQRLQYAFVIA